MSTIKIKPEFSAVINGAPFHLAGDSTTPFKDSLESTLGIKIDKLEIAKYLEYSPVTLNFKVPSGQLNGKVTASFKSAPENRAGVGAVRRSQRGCAGDAATERRAAAQIAQASMSWSTPSKSSPIRRLSNRSSPKASNSMSHSTVKAKSIWPIWLTPSANSQPAPEQKKDDDKPFVYQIEEIALDGATIHFTDEQPQQPYKTRLDNVSLKVTGLNNEADKKANVETFV